MSNNNVKALFNQQYGFGQWRNCDTAIKRLRCTRQNAYTQMFSSSNSDDGEIICDTPIFACKFASQEGNEHFVALANEDGKLAIHNTDSNTRYGVEAHNNAIFDLAWTFDQMRIVTASGDHTSKMYNVGNGEIRQEKIFFGHTRSVKTVAFQKDCSNVFATGGRDGNIIMWDSRSELRNLIGQPDNKIMNSHNSKSFTPSKPRKKSSTPTNFGVKSVTGLVFQNENTLISCGAGDGNIKVWDLRKNYYIHKKEAVPKYTIPYSGSTSKNGFSNLIIDSQCIKLYANCLDNTIYCYNLASYNTEPVMCYTGHQNNTFYIKSSLCRNGDYLVSGSSDEHAYIWNIKQPQPIVKLTGHNAEVTCVAWCYKNNKTMITCSDDMTHKIWTVGTEDLPDDWDIVGMGKAELLSLEQAPIKSSLKRILVDGPIESSSHKKFIVPCERCKASTNCLRFCENCNVTSTKRKATSVLFNDNKKQLTDFGPRRLFSNINQNIPHESQELAKILEVNKNDPVDVKDETNKLGDGLKLNGTVNCDDLGGSPTVNLPNFVVDGIAPHLNYSPTKRKSQDWLTKIRIERNLRKEMEDKTIGPSASKMPKLTLTPKRRTSCSAAKSPLLRFFKVTNSSVNKCDSLACSNRTQCSSTSFVTSSQSRQ